MTLNSLIEPTQPVSGSVNRVTGFLTNLVDKGLEYKILREENKLALSQKQPANDQTSDQSISSKPDLGSGKQEITNPIVYKQDNLFITYGVPAIAVLSGLIAIYAITRRKGKK
jgi:hypothetical protein